MMERLQIHEKWTSKENYTYNYMVVTIGGKVVRVFNSHRHTISPNSEVFNYFVQKLES